MQTSPPVGRIEVNVADGNQVVAYSNNNSSFLWAAHRIRLLKPLH